MDSPISNSSYSFQFSKQIAMVLERKLMIETISQSFPTQKSSSLNYAHTMRGLADNNPLAPQVAKVGTEAGEF